jgi:hypothetical protein
MAAVAMIVGESDDLQLGFPSAYASQYSAVKAPLRAFPSVQEPVTTFWAGDDLQAQWHEQKRKDANYMSGAKVQSTQNSIKRAYSAPHHLYNHPKYVLGQRKFANPSVGAQILNSGRQSYDSAPFHYASAHVVPNRQMLPSEMEGAGDCCDTFRGGVLRSAAGQVHGHNMLRARVGQLDAIDAAKQEFQMMMPDTTLSGVVTPSMAMPGSTSFVDSFQQQSTELSVPIKINLGLQRVIDLLMGADVLNTQESGFRSADSIFSETRSVLGGVLAMGARATVSELSDTLGLIQRIEQLLQASLETDSDDPYMDEYANKQAQATYITLQDLYKKLNTYLTRMVAGANLQPRERDTLARSLVKSLGFGKSMDVAVGKSREALSLAERTGTPAARQDAMNVASNGKFNDEGDRREDTEHGSRGSGPGGAWGDSNRTEFGWRSGESFPTNGRSVSWFGTEDGRRVEYNEAPEDTLQEEVTRKPLQSGRLPSVRGTPTATSVTSDVPLRGFFDPDTQAFNVSSSFNLPSRGSLTKSRDGQPNMIPQGLESQSRRGRNVVNLMKGELPSESPELPSRSTLRRPAYESRETNPRSPVATPRVAVPQSTADLPDDLKELEKISEGLRAKGYFGVPRIYGTKQALGSAGYKSYIRNVKLKIIENTRG